MGGAGFRYKTDKSKLCADATMPLSNTTGSGDVGVPLSVTFESPVDYLIFIFQILFATTAVLVACSVASAILATRALYMQNRFIFMVNTSQHL